MEAAAHITPRQIWAQPTTTTSKTYSTGCTPIVLPTHARVYLNRSYIITLSENAIYEPICTGQVSLSHASAVLDTRDPFYSSVTPQLYTIGCATVISYLLVIILLITPRTFYVGGPGGGANFLGRRGMMSGSYSGNSSVVGVGGRPWLQKVAAIMVAISLTIASVDSFRVAERQYNYGYSDAEALTEEVTDGMESRIVLVISSTFLWLAQVQTLIRLFPRHKEKVMIKWAGFALIVLDTIFSSLNNFLLKSDTTRPRLYDDAIPALSYLFELALNLLYAAWVIFYSLSKHRFAFFHPKMRNICLVALLSLCAIFIPVVFFVLDISQPSVAGWGTYVRWVGSAAASVVVWEWVERIEALERDERKDGILGREVFDGDEMLEVTPSEEVDWPRQQQPLNGGPKRGPGSGPGTSSGWGNIIGLAHRPLRTRRGGSGVGGVGGVMRRHRTMLADRRNHLALGRAMARQTPPPPTVTPISRVETTSAASTVYQVRHHTLSSPSPPVPMPQMEEEQRAMSGEEDPKEGLAAVEEAPADNPSDDLIVAIQQQQQQQQQQLLLQQIVPDRTSPLHTSIIHTQKPRWRSMLAHFRRRRTSLPREVASAQVEGDQLSCLSFKEVDDSDGEDETSSSPALVTDRPSRTEHLPTFQLGRRPGWGRPSGGDASLPVTIIPARRQGQQQAWSPQLFDGPGLRDDPSPNSRRRPDSASSDPSNDCSAAHPHLPVRVIPAQSSQTAVPWTVPGGGETLESPDSPGHLAGQQLRYDPETAALVGPGLEARPDQQDTQAGTTSS
ncbi:hypothetical protein ASPZODRAFT_21563 [Penicilliopsis zonata CBS 506.65]|uniref:PH-response regulator protein palH/RIM21 n=1 Tax=Penicilliopsis zonata CBS 506.65 TaxID=1073090 RepID=A0A1L9SV06_9EURO|nr:hypothetical protein ASPZODRAFT_21563 [Penicilliopsis zonata CBS 506.65]OJJ51060.1 hypothetical protein ASPZODRAFT_21563 [Penicilliopsis zonata CBS 506.65]